MSIFPTKFCTVVVCTVVVVKNDLPLFFTFGSAPYASGCLDQNIGDYYVCVGVVIGGEEWKGWTLVMI